MSEKLDGIRYDGWELVIEVTGGGVAELMPRGLGADVVADRLRHLARALELNVAKRSPTIAAPETLPLPPTPAARRPAAKPIPRCKPDEHVMEADPSWGDDCLHCAKCGIAEYQI